MSKTIKILLGLSIPIIFLFGFSIDRYFMSDEKGWIYTLIATGCYTIWFLYYKIKYRNEE